MVAELTHPFMSSGRQPCRDTHHITVQAYPRLAQTPGLSPAQIRTARRNQVLLESFDIHQRITTKSRIGVTWPNHRHMDTLIVKPSLSSTICEASVRHEALHKVLSLFNPRNIQCESLLRISLHRMHRTALECHARPKLDMILSTTPSLKHALGCVGSTSRKPLFRLTGPKAHDMLIFTYTSAVRATLDSS